jgi:nucleoside-diphosphate-sugar epimerase
MSSCVIFGGSGYIGTHLARHFLNTGRFDHVHIADIRPTPLVNLPGISYSQTDVRQPIPIDLKMNQPEWVFNLAAIHREPGHEPYEYYETNLAGARNVCDYAEAVRCRNIYFTSSISVYGPTAVPTDESTPRRPSTPYGGSKYSAEAIHQAWQGAGRGRRLLISRPGVVYGPGDPGNIMRMIRAIKRGYFAFPGSPSIYKSYGYIYGFIDSVEYLMDRDDPQVIYNYVEAPTEPLCDIVRIVKQHLSCRAVSLPLPLWLLLPAAHLIQACCGSKNPIHPVRVRKAATPTHIVPKTLDQMGFEFRYDFAESLRHWQQVAPEDFGLPFSDSKEEKVRQLRIHKRAESVESSSEISDRARSAAR